MINRDVWIRTRESVTVTQPLTSPILAGTSFAAEAFALVVWTRSPYYVPSAFPFPQLKAITLPVTFLDGSISVTFPFGETSTAEDTSSNPSLYGYKVYATSAGFAKKVIIRGIVRVLFSEPATISFNVKSPYPKYVAKQNTTITTQQQAAIYWEQPAGVTAGIIVTGYKVTISYPDGTTQVASTTAPWYTFTGLEQKTTYSVTVTAITDIAGEAKPSAALTFTTDATDLAPVLSATGKTISWTAPDVQPQPLDYAIQYKLPDGRTFVTKANDVGAGTSRQYEFTMPSGVQYEVKVAAISQLGVLSWSSLILVGASGPPGAVVLSQSALVGMVPTFSWSPPTNNGGGEVTSYSVSVLRRAADGSTFELVSQMTLPAGTTAYTVPTAAQGETYQIKVRAVNSFGQSESPTSSSLVLAAKESLPPRNLSLSPGDKTLEVSWQGPTDFGGGAFSWYEVTCAPSDQSSPAVVSYVRSQGTTKTSIDNLTNGKTYSVTVVVVTNISATTIQSASSTSISGTATVQALPEVPTGVTLVPSNARLDISWTAPLSPVTGYKVYITRSSTGSVITRTVSGTLLAETGLVNDETYYVQVSGLSDSGEGSKSAAVSKTVGEIPPAPPGLQVVPGVKSLVVSWSEPFSSTPVKAYSVLYKQQGGSAYTDVPVSAKSLTISGLANSTAYVVSVRALNSVGPGPYSTEVTATTTGLLAAPTQVSAVPLGNGTATVKWTPPYTTSDQPIIRYLVKVDGASQTAGQSGFLASGFGGGHATQHTVSVAAETAGGVGAYSTPISARGSVASQPSGFTAVGGVGLVETSWADQANDSVPVLGYVLSYRKSSSDASTTIRLPSSAKRQTVDGLDEGSLYSFSLLIVDDVGEGFSATATATVQPRPGIPTGLSVTADNGRLAISWYAPSLGATGYKVYITQASNGIVVVRAVSGTSLSETGLVNGESYSVQVSAINVAGESDKTTAVSKIVCAVSSPTQVAAVPDGFGQATVTWTPPYTPSNLPITRYSVKVDGVVQTTSQTRLTATGFGGGHATQHTVSVAAETAAGLGAYSAPISIPGDVAASPTGFTAVAGSGSVYLSWPTQANDGVPVLGFVLAYSKAVGGAESRITLPASATSYTASNLENGKLYNFWLAIVDSAGEGLHINSGYAATPLGVPETVVGVTTSARAKGMVISWTAPRSNSNIGITNYSVEYTPAGGSATVISSGGGQTTSIGLYAKTPAGSPLYPPAVNILASTTYTVRVAASNDVGTGPWSAPATVTTLAVATPSAPTRLAVDDRAYSDLFLTWYPPADTGTSDIQGYILNIAAAGQTAANITLTPPAVSIDRMSAYQAKNLTHAANYTISVYAYNADGTSTAVTTQAGPSGGPIVTSLAATGGDKTVNVSWGVPDITYSGNSGELSYSVQIADGVPPAGSGGFPTSAPGFQEYTASGLSYTFSGVANGRSYTLAVATKKNGALIGPYTYAAAITGGVPTEPTAFTATPTKTGMQLRWQEPADTYGKAIYPLTKYNLTLSANDGSADKSVAVTPGSTSYLHTGLIPNAAYWYSISAENAKGVSDWHKAQIAQKYWSIVPGVVTGVTTSVTGNAITVRWGVPADQGLEAVYRYRIDISLSGRSQWDIVDAPATYRTLSVWPVVAGTPTQSLSRGTYTILVAAINSSGVGPTVSTTATIV